MKSGPCSRCRLSGTWDFDTPRCSGTMSRAGPPSQLAEVTAEEIKDTLNARQVTASGFVGMHSAHMLKQIRKAAASERRVPGGARRSRILTP